jgi:hypothetical protein
MNEDSKRKEMDALQADLAGSGLSRRAFLDRLKGLGVGFGAAFILGVNEFDAQAKDAPVPAEGLSVQSSNPAVDAIIGEGQEDRLADATDPEEKQKAGKYGKYDKYDKYTKYGKYDKYTKYAKYDKYAKYTKYDKYTKYAKYDKYTKYAKYDKYTKYARYSKALPDR